MSLSNVEYLITAIALTIFSAIVLGICLIAFTATVYLGVIVRKSPVFLISTYHIFFDIVIVCSLFLWLYPSAILGYEITPHDGIYSIFVGALVLYGWVYISMSNICMALNRFLIICYNRHDLFTYSRIHYISVLLMLVSFVIIYVGEILPCCKPYFNYRTISQGYMPKDNYPNFNSIYIVTPVNVMSTICSFLMYAYIFYFLRKAKMDLKHSTKKTRNDQRFAFQFFAISIFHFLEYSSLRLLPILFRSSYLSPDYNPILTMPTVFIASNSAMNSVVYLLTNMEVQKTVRKFIYRSIGKPQVNITSTQSGFIRDTY